MYDMSCVNIINQINKVVNSWNYFALENRVNEKLRKTIQNNLHTV